MNRNVKTDKDTVTIDQMCATLLISQATARNWIKSGKIKPVKTASRKLCFLKKDVDKLLQSIQSGESDKLTRRRNKTKHTGNVVPAGYVAKKEYTEAAKRIVAGFDSLGGGEKLIAITLAEYSMKLMASRGLIAHGGGVYCEKYFKDQSFLGGYRKLIDDILAPAGASLEDVHSAGSILIENIEYIETEDFLGLLYMSISSIAKRKTEGVYYTPKKIAEDCAEYLKDKGALTGKKILDPCCGTGNFMMNVFSILKEETNKSGEDIIKDSIFAADIDYISICLARINLTVVAKLCDISVLYQNFKVTDSLFDFDDESFDVIISNPPWGSAYTAEYEQKIKDRYGLDEATHIESFTMFLTKAIRICKTGGNVCYVLPQSFLNVMAHDKTRENVAKTCDIMKVKYWRNIFDKVYAPSITITLRKGKTGAEYIEAENGGGVYRISTRRLLKSSLFNFSVTDEQNDLIIKLDELPSSVRLYKNADFALGIVTGDNKAFLKERHIKETEPVLRGIDLEAYTYRKPERYIKFDPKKFQQVAPEQYYRAPEKLLYKFISSSMCFAYDDKQTLSLNSCNILIPRFGEEIPIKYVLAVLNSKVAQFYFANKFQSVKVLRSHIESIPIPVPAPETAKRVCDIVDEIIKSENAELRRVLIEKLDEEMMDVFGLSAEEKKLVSE